MGADVAGMQKIRSK